MAVIKYYNETYGKYISLPIGDNTVVEVDNTSIQPNIYSTTEQVIGKWIDGRPIYRRVIAWSATSTSSYKTGTIATLTSVSSITNLYNMVYNTTENTIFTATDGTSDSYQVITQFYPSSGALSYNIIWGGSSGVKYTVKTIVEYTKTTDAENSFTVSMLPTVSTSSETLDTVLDRDRTATDEEVESCLSGL